MSIQNTIVVVDEEPFCIWEIDIKERNREFLNSIDVGYFDYALNQHLKAEDEKRASVALQLTYHHALETLFSYIGALVQAPNCVYAWIEKCKNIQLRNIVKKINTNDENLYSRFKIDRISWKTVASKVFECYQPSKEKQEETIDLFSDLWSKLAYEFLDENHISEYNSMKHGFRVRTGGFGLSVGLEQESGVSPPADEMNVIGHSDFGLSFFKLEKIGLTNKNGNRSFRSRRHSINWKIEKTIILLQLINFSINNVVGCLKVLNGENAKNIKFTRPIESELFSKAWSYNCGVNNLTMDFGIEDKQVSPTTKKELLKRLIEPNQS